MKKKTRTPDGKKITDATVSMTKQVLDQIEQSIGRHPAETGGILGSSDGGRTIDHYYFDAAAHRTSSTYTPNIREINRIIADWNSRGILFMGMIHSHPKGCTKPSEGDLEYAKAIISNVDVNGKLYMPIVQVNTPPDGKIRLHSYTLETDVLVKEQKVQYLDDYRAEPKEPRLREKDLLSKNRFQRIERSLPMGVLKHKTIVGIGSGGAISFYENLARSGFPNFIIFDGDSVSDTNIATQEVYISDIGLNKAELVKRRILDINPKANVIAVPRFLNDSFEDSKFEELLGEKTLENPTNILICGCTDNHMPQARAANLALKYGTTYLGAQLYREGVAGEIYFSYPGVTNSCCPRCAMSARYDAYEAGYKNDVTSDGVSIQATQMLNAVKGEIAKMLLLYHEDKHCCYDTMLDDVSDRNFVMIRMKPAASVVLNNQVFENVLSGSAEVCFAFETVWLPQKPNNEANGFKTCPLCGGTGDLKALKGKIKDSRNIA